MHLARLGSVLLLCLGGCGDSPSAASDSHGGSGGSTGVCMVGFPGCPCAEDDLCLTGLACVDQQCVGDGATSSEVPTGSVSDSATQGSASTVSTGTASSTTDTASTDTANTDTASTASTGQSTALTASTTDATSTDTTVGQTGTTEVSSTSASDSSTGAAVVCGDGVAEGDEACDGGDLQGDTCVTQGFKFGALGCTPACALDTTKCSDSAVCGDGVIVQDVLCYAPTKSLKSYYVRWLALGDMNEDGHLDIVGSSYKIGVVVQFGLGDGTVTPYAQDRANPNVQVERPLIVDIDKDGHLDVLARSNNSDKLQIALGDGTGALTNTVSYDVFPSLYDFAVGDVDVDGWLDLVWCNANLKKVNFRRGQPGGLFGPVISYTTDPVYSGFRCGFHDVDRDGHLDMWSQVGPNFQVWNGDGAAKFTLDPTKTKIAGADYMHVGDLNADDYTDLTGFSISFQTELNVVHGSALGFDPMIYKFAIADNWPTQGREGNFDGNAVLDVVVASESLTGLKVFRGDGTGLFYDGATVDTGKEVRSLAIGDMNEDGLDDFVTAHWSNEVQGLAQKVTLSDP